MKVFLYSNDTATAETYTLSLHDALPIFPKPRPKTIEPVRKFKLGASRRQHTGKGASEGNSPRSEEHTSELQSQFHLVCRLLLEKKNSEVQRPIGMKFPGLLMILLWM